MADGQDRNFVEKLGAKIRAPFKRKDQISGSPTMNIENYIAIAKKEVWFVRYTIAIILLIFFCYELHIVISTCVSDRGCKEGNAPWTTIFEGLKAAISGIFVTIILGKAVVPLINAFITWRIGGTAAAIKPDKDEPPKTVTTTTETKVG